MSAITGILNLDGEPVEASLLAQMTQVLAHRGPDGTGQWMEGPIGLGHRLLRTTPESSHETQPMMSADGRFVLVCDARIDNRTELLSALEMAGTSESEIADPQFILRAYERWGPACAEHLVGDFAFAIWDRWERRLFCARDPIGVKPFYYFWDGRRVVFASEIKALLVVPGVPTRINEAMVADYLLSDFHDPDATFFARIHQLRPAHGLRVEDGQRRLVRYWDANPHATISYPHDEDYLERFCELFREAVHCRLRSATPVGVMLSGGIDSTAVTAMGETLRDEHPHLPSLRAFTVLMEGFLEEEWEALQHLKRRLGTTVHLIHPPTGQNRWALFEPCDPRSEVPRPAILIYPIALQSIDTTGVRTLLTGFASDELIGISELGILKDLMRSVRLRTLAAETRRMAWMGRISQRGILFYVLRNSIPRPIRWRLKALAGRQLPSWIEPGFANRMGLRHRVPVSMRHRFPTLCQEESYRTLTSPQMALDLSQLDSVVSSFHLEWRYPFLDRRLIEFFLAVPAEVKRRAGPRKFFLQRAVQGIVPGGLREQEGKELIPLPNDRQTWEAEARWIAHTLVSPPAPVLSYVDEPHLHRLLNEFVEGHLEHRTPLWKLVHLDRWMRAFFGGTTN